jgi:hypothetical protein
MNRKPDSALVAQTVESAEWEPPARVAALAVEAPNPDRIARRLSGPVLAAQLDGLSWAQVADPGGPGRRAEIEATVADMPAALGPGSPGATPANRRDAPGWH